MVKKVDVLKEEAFRTWLAWEFAESAHRYQESRRAEASVVPKDKIQVWKEFREEREWKKHFVVQPKGEDEVRSSDIPEGVC